MKKRLLIENIFIYLFLGVIFVITAFPLVYTVASSFKTNMEIMAEPARVFPAAPTLENYVTVWTDPAFNAGLMGLNSLYYTLANVLIAVVTASMGGYVFARGRFPFKRLIFGCFISLMFIKVGNIGIYATFQVLGLLRLDRSLPALILLNVFGVPIVNVYLVRGYVSTIPRAVDEAAKIDGCDFFGIYCRVILPMLKPILATVAILTFQWSWNDYIMPTIFTMTNPKQQTLIVGLMALKSGGGAASSWNLMLAGSAIALIPVVAAYACAGKYFVSGLAAGAVKE
ncbi:MAG: carbohydrate ABC transporter permease [Clostridiales bacterium]|jgi:multiple sugar transport system permease protein|nr:carbohydrate ABC transporter permease [Clostridiales bacterium]